MDVLEARKLVERKLCPSDGRARNAWLTPRGLNLLRAAQATHFAGVQRLFFDHMAPEEVAALAATFGRFAPDGAGSCSA
jgi:DNA-binding MarR family transcriptional regulator